MKLQAPWAYEVQVFSGFFGPEPKVQDIIMLGTEELVSNFF